MKIFVEFDTDKIETNALRETWADFQKTASPTTAFLRLLLHKLRDGGAGLDALGFAGATTTSTPSPAAAEVVAAIPGFEMGFSMGQAHKDCREFQEMMQEMDEFLRVFGENLFAHVAQCDKGKPPAPADYGPGSPIGNA